MPLPRRQLVSLDAVRFWRFHTASAESSHPSVSVDRLANLTRFRRRFVMYGWPRTGTYCAGRYPQALVFPPVPLDAHSRQTLDASCCDRRWNRCGTSRWLNNRNGGNYPKTDDADRQVAPVESWKRERNLEPIGNCDGENRT